MVLSRQARINVQRISRGRPPEDFGADTQRFLNEATDFINANPSLRARVERQVPTGLSPLRAELFKRGEATRLDVQRTPEKVVDRASRNLVFKQFREGSVSRAEAIGLLRGSEARKTFERKQAREEAKVTAEEKRLRGDREIKPSARGTRFVPKVDFKDRFQDVDISPEDLEKIKFQDGKVDVGTIQIRTQEEEREFRRRQEDKALGLGEFVEKAEVALFPALVNKKFLDSQLGALITSGELQAQDLEIANRVNELLPKTAGFGVEATKASVELLNLIKATDRSVQRDIKTAEKTTKTFDKLGNEMNQINTDLESGKISNDLAIRKQNIILNKFNNAGFLVDEKDGNVNISHPVYDRLGQFTGSAWSNILKDARKRDSIKDEALIGTLSFLNNAYETEKIVLAFQLAGKVGLKFPAVTGTEKQVKVFNTISKLSGGALIGTFGAAKGVETLGKTGEPLLALTSGAGTIAGFLAPSALQKSNELLKKLDKQVTKILGDPSQAPERLGMGVGGKAGKVKQVQVKKKVKKKVKLQVTSKQAQDAFKKLSRSEQIKIIEKALRGKPVSQLELNQAKTFMRRSGLLEFQIEDRLAETMRRIQVSYIRQLQRGDKQLGIDPDPRLKQQLKQLLQGKNRLVKVLKTRIIASQTPQLNIVQAQKAKVLNVRIAKVQKQLAQGFLTPLQENILRNQLLTLKTSLGLLTKSIPKKTITTTTISPQTISLQRQVALSKVKQTQIQKQIQQATTKTRQAFLQRQLQVQKQRQVQLQGLLTKQVQRTKQLQNQRSLALTTQQLRSLTIQRQRQNQMILSLTRQRQASKSDTRQGQLFLQISKLKTSQRQIAKQTQKLKLIERGLTKQIKQPKTPGVKTPVIPFLFGTKKKKGKKSVRLIPTQKKKNFQVFVRKGGKDVLFKSFKTKPKARAKLKKNLSRTLRASGFIFDKKLKRKVKPKVTKGFRLGKKDKFRIVEKKNLRLDSKREVKQIQQAKRIKKPFKPNKSIMGKKLKKRKK